MLELIRNIIFSVTYRAEGEDIYWLFMGANKKMYEATAAEADMYKVAGKNVLYVDAAEIFAVVMNRCV